VYQDHIVVEQPSIATTTTTSPSFPSSTSSSSPASAPKSLGSDDVGPPQSPPSPGGGDAMPSPRNTAQGDSSLASADYKSEIPNRKLSAIEIAAADVKCSGGAILGPKTEVSEILELSEASPPSLPSLPSSPSQSSRPPTVPLVDFKINMQHYREFLDHIASSADNPDNSPAPVPAAVSEADTAPPPVVDPRATRAQIMSINDDMEKLVSVYNYTYDTAVQLNVLSSPDDVSAAESLAAAVSAIIQTHSAASPPPSTSGSIIPARPRAVSISQSEISTRAAIQAARDARVRVYIHVNPDGTVRVLLQVGETSGQVLTRHNRKMRRQLESELVSSERAYFLKLQALRRYIKGLNTHFALPESQFDILWTSIDTISEIHTEVDLALYSGDDIVTVFQENMDYFKMYAMYAQNYMSLLQVLNELSAKKTFLRYERASSQVGSDTSVVHAFLQPIRRFLRTYQLLSELQLYMPQSDKDYVALQRVVHSLGSVVHAVREHYQVIERRSAVVAMQLRFMNLQEPLMTDSREFVHQGTAQIDSAAVSLFLFNDLLIWATLAKPDHMAGQLPITTQTIAHTSTTHTSTIQVSTSGQTVPFRFMDIDSKTHWLDVIRQCVSALQSMHAAAGHSS
jgi:RhoGEF domain